MLVGNQRGNLSRAPATALSISLEAPNEPVDITPWYSAHRYLFLHEEKKTDLTLHRVSTIKFLLPANVNAQSCGNLVRTSYGCWGP